MPRRRRCVPGDDPEGSADGGRTSGQLSTALFGRPLPVAPMGHNAVRDDAQNTSMTPAEFARRSATTDHRHPRPAVTHPRTCRPGRTGRDDLKSGPDDQAERPSIATREAADGSRVSTVHRPDGSSFTVSVPRGAMDGESAGRSRRWINGDAPADPASDAALRRLAELIMPPGGPAVSSRRDGVSAHRHRLER